MVPLQLHFSALEQAALSSPACERIATACALGAAIGLEREYKKKPCGLRTLMFICMGAAFFTFMSPILAGEGGGNRGAIASNIVQGIGFLGAGLILHNKNRVVGLTSAATVWVVASVGMACGAGLYLPAVFATIIVLIALQLMGLLELKLNLKMYPLTYEVRGVDQESLSTMALEVLDRYHHRFQACDHGRVAGKERLVFSTIAKAREHKFILAELRSRAGTENAFVYREEDED